MKAGLITVWVIFACILGGILFTLPADIADNNCWQYHAR